MDATKTLLGIIAMCPFSCFKVRAYRLLGADMERSVYLAPGVVIVCRRLGNLKVGASSSLGLNTKIFCERATIGRRVCIGGDCNIRGEGNLWVGDDVFIGVGCILDCKGELLISEGVQIAPGARILTHDTSGNFYFRKPLHPETTRVLARAYIGTGAILLPGVTVGCEATVGAGAVVTKSVAPRQTVVGVPARRVQKKRGIPDPVLGSGDRQWTEV